MLFRRSQTKPRTCPQGHPQEPSWEKCPFCTAEEVPQGTRSEGGDETASSSSPPSEPGRSAVVVPKKNTAPPKRVLAGWLVAVSGTLEGQDFRVHHGKNVLGKGTQVDIVIKDAYVSERHALFDCRDAVFTITDLDSKHGTFVNGHQIPEPRTVSDGDRITLGHTELKFRSFE